MANQPKTNTCRLLEKAKLPYRLCSYDHGDGQIDGPSVAAKLGQDPAQVFKTLVTQAGPGDYRVFVLPCCQELDLKAAARAAGVKAIQMLPLKELTKVTGYIRGGCSPLAMKKQYPTVFDQSCRQFDRIFVSAGKIGLQLEAAPQDLIQLTGAAVAPVTMEQVEA